MKNTPLVESHVGGDTKDINRCPDTKVLVDRPKVLVLRLNTGGLNHTG